MATYIMSEHLFSQLCQIQSFNHLNGKTYQQHILIIAGERIPSQLHPSILEAPSPHAALEILTKHNIPYSHTYKEEN